MAGVNRPGPRREAGQLDRCPGVLRPHQAADGAMIRVRVPGGQTTGAELTRLSAVAARYGSGLLQLTSRASLQLRGLPEVLPDELVAEITAAGFLPSVDHERVRNIVASPLTGLHDGLSDLRPMIKALDRAIVEDPDLVELPGRFLFALDDGRGDVTGLTFDLAYRATGADHGLVLVGSADQAITVPSIEAVPTMINRARRFLSDRSATGAWHLRELDSAARRTSSSDSMITPLGRIGTHAGVAVPFGHLSPNQVQVIDRVVGGGPVVITPWRGLVVPGAAAHLEVLAQAGLVVDDSSSWTLLSACVGAPWCGNGRVDTHQLAQILSGLPLGETRVHLSGCERRCGAPAGDHLDLVAPTRAEAVAAIGSRNHG